MKRIFFISFITALVAGVFSSCENSDWEFPDYEYSAVYFAYQSPIRTLTLGEDICDTSMDNNYQSQIMATMGGVYKDRKSTRLNSSHVRISYAVFCLKKK